MKRIQISVDDEMYQLLMELRDLRGESPSLIIGGILDYHHHDMKREMRELKRLEARQAELKKQAERIRRRRGERQEEFDV